MFFFYCLRFKLKTDFTFSLVYCRCVSVVHIIHAPYALNNAENTNEDDYLQFE